jgi:hypothetical protein
MPVATNHKPNHPHRVALDGAIAVLNHHETWKALIDEGLVDQHVIVDAWIEDPLVYVIGGPRGPAGQKSSPRLAVALVNNKMKQVLAIRLVNFEFTGRVDDIQTCFESPGLEMSVADAKGFRFDVSTSRDTSRT